VRRRDFLAGAAALGAVSAEALAAESLGAGHAEQTGPRHVTTGPLRLHPDNPHYFLWRGKPTVLITSGEHYGAVLNLDFDYRRYLPALEQHSFNLTRVFSGVYCEAAGSFGIQDNTLAPAEGRLICPWGRSNTQGSSFGGAKFDLAKWDDAYFVRLRDFVAEADRHGVIVEVVLFCTFYDDSMWRLSPLNGANNVNGVGDVPRHEVYALKHQKLVSFQEAMVRKTVRELDEFDNVYFEICNEPYERRGQTMEWQERIARTIVETERGLPKKHLIAQNLPRPARDRTLDGQLARPVPNVSILNFHGARSPDYVALYYDANRPVAFDETGGRDNDTLRAGAWNFIMSGGAVFDHLDFSYTVGHEAGTSTRNAKRAGGPELRRQLTILKAFIDSFDFVNMKPDNSVIKGGVPSGATAHALVRKGHEYAIYMHGGNQVDLVLDLPAGDLTAEWVDTKSGRIARRESFRHEGQNRTFRSPHYSKDVALRISRRQKMDDLGGRITEGIGRAKSDWPFAGIART